MEKYLLLMRHGESFSNVGKIFASRSIDYDLTGKGKTQIEEAIPTIRQFQPGIVYCSPSKRTVQTAQIIALSINVPVETDARLLEADVGMLEGKDEYAEPYFSQFDQTLSAWESGRYSHAFPSGESFADLNNRLASFLREAIEPSAESNILIVSHCITLMMFQWLYRHRRGNKLRDNYIGTASTVFVPLSDGMLLPMTGVGGFSQT